MLKALKSADRALDACGRAVAPPGYHFIDLSYFIPVKATFVSSASPTAPYQIRIKNNSLTTFICRGLIFGCRLPVRVKWPSGRYLSQNPFHALADGSPIGAGGNMIALDVPVEIEAGANISIEVSA